MIEQNWLQPNFPDNQGAQNTFAEMPVGFGMRLVQDEHARLYFDSLAPAERQRLISYIQVATTGEDAKQRISHVMDGLKNNSLDFLSRLT